MSALELACDQLQQRLAFERFVEERVGACRRGARGGMAVIASRHRHHREAAVAIGETIQDCDAVEPGKVEVEHEAPSEAGTAAVEKRRSAGERLDLVGMRFEEHAKR